MSNVGFATLQIIPSAKGFGAALGGQTNGPLAAQGASGGKKFGGSLVAGASKALAPLAAIAGGAALAGFLKSAVDQASDLNEAGTALQQVFGKGTENVKKFAQGSATTLGQSTLQTEQAAQSFGVYGKAAGLAGDANAKFSTDLVGLSGDLASFYNTSPEEAIQAIGSGLRGEAEPLRRFGVLLDDATLRQEAMRQGLIKNTKTALTPQQKVLAAHAVILRQTKVAQGDFARTSGGLANQQRILAAKFTNLKGTLGKFLLPVVLKVVSGMNGLFDVVPKISGAVQGFFAGIGGGGAGGKASAVFGQIASVARTFAHTLTTEVLPTALAFGRTLATTLFPILRQIATIIATNVVPIVASLARFFYGSLIPAVLSIVRSIAGSLAPVLAQLAATMRSQVLPTVQSLLVHFHEIQPTLQKVVSVVLVVVGAVLRLTAAILGKVLPVLIRLVGFLLGNVIRALIVVVTGIVKAIAAVVRFGATIVGAVSSAAKFSAGIAKHFASAVTYVAGLPAKIVRALGHLGGTLLSAGGDLMGGFIQGIRNKAGDLVNTIKQTITDKLPGFVKKALGIHSPSRVFMALGGHVAEGMALGIENGSGRVTSAAKTLVNVPSVSDAFGAGSSAMAGLGAPTPVTVPVMLDGRVIAEAVFDVGGREYGYGRKG